MLFPIIGTILYLNVSHYLKTQYRERSINRYINVGKVYWNICVLHNAFLVLFNLYIFKSIVGILSTRQWIVTHQYFMADPQVDRLIFWFYLSKYYEYMDTFLIYLKGRDPIFLQKYHHIGAVFCWYLCYEYKVDMIIFGTLLNSFVHTIMYSYYLLTLFRLPIRQFRIYLTLLQIIQLLVGGWSGLYFYVPPLETFFNYFIIGVFNLYIFGLVILFGNFMLHEYC